MSESGSKEDIEADDSVANHCSASGSSDEPSLKVESEIVAMEAADTARSPSTDKVDTGENIGVASPSSVAMETSDNVHGAAILEDADCGTGSAKCDKPDVNHSDHGDVETSFTKLSDTLDPGEADSADLVLGVLKKDDSGIVCEKSPIRDTDSSKTDPDGNSSASASHGEGAKLRTHYPSTSNESEGVVADFVDDVHDVETGVLLKSASDEDRMSGDDGPSEGASASARTKKRLAAQKRHRHVRPHDSDSQSEPERGEDTVSDDEDTESEAASCDEDMDVDLTSVPRDPWRPLNELRQREQGHSPRMQMPFLFRASTGSSVNLVKRLTMQCKLEHHDGCVNALHFNDSGTLLASGSDDLNIVIWDWARARRYMVFESGHRSNVFQSKFMPYTEDMHIVSCARDGQVRLAELSTTGVCKGTKKLAQHRGAAHKLALLSDSSHVFYSCGEDGVTFEIDLRQDKPNKLSTTKENNKKVPLYSIHSNPFKSHEFCVGGRDHLIRVYDKRMLGGEDEGTPVKKFCPHHLVESEIKANVTCAVYNYNGTEILGTYNDEHIYLFNSEHSDGADYIHRYRGHRNNATVKGVNFYGPRSEFVVSGSDCSNVLLWDKESEKIVQYFHADEGGVINVLEPHPHNPVLATSGLDHDVKIWAPTAKEPTSLDGLRQVVRKNHKDREEERAGEPDMIDGQMLWLLMQHLRRTTRRRARQEGEDASTSTSDSEPESDDDDGSEDMPEGVQCASS